LDSEEDSDEQGAETMNKQIVDTALLIRISELTQANQLLNNAITDLRKEIDALIDENESLKDRLHRASWNPDILSSK
jgi:FtsZ-binding cell division protein ZapB